LSTARHQGRQCSSIDKRGRNVQERSRPAAKPPAPGQRWSSKILECAGLAQSTAYEALVAKARGIMAPAASALGPRKRPAAKTKRGMRRTADQGGLVKKDPAERLVREEHDRGAHIEQALRADFPFLGDRYELTDACQSAITTTLSREGKKLADWRARQVRALEAIRSAALPIDAAWKRQISDVSAGVKNLRKPFNVAFLAILLDAMKWPDISLCSCLLRGFPLAGDLSAQTSNIFVRKCLITKATFSYPKTRTEEAGNGTLEQRDRPPKTKRKFCPATPTQPIFLQEGVARTSGPSTTVTVSFSGRRRCVFLPLNS